MEAFHRLFVGLCICSIACGLPLPRLQATPFLYREVRPASLQFTVSAADFTPSFYGSSMQGRFDPDRSYIQMILPNTEDIAVAAKKPNDLHPVEQPTKNPEEEIPSEPPTCRLNSSAIILNGTITLNVTFLNGTNLNGTNITNCSNETLRQYLRNSLRVSAPAVLMLADGTSIGAEQDEPSLTGTYELAYVAQRPSAVYSASPQLYPFVKYVNYNQIPWRGSPLIIGNPYPAEGIYEPIYIYRPVFPILARSYDVYYYFSTADQQNIKRQENTKVVQESKAKTIPTKLDTKPVSELKVNSEKEDAKENVMPNTMEEVGPQEKALVDALNSQAEIVEENTAPPVNLQLKEETAVAETDMDGKDDYHLNEDDNDLMRAVERVLQQLHSRLTA